METEIVFKKRFLNKHLKLLTYLDEEFGWLAVQRYERLLKIRLQMLKQNPEVGQPTNWPDVRSVQTSSHIRIFYRIAGNKVIILNHFSLKINPVKRPFQ